MPNRMLRVSFMTPLSGKPDEFVVRYRIKGSSDAYTEVTIDGEEVMAEIPVPMENLYEGNIYSKCGDTLSEPLPFSE